MPNSALLISSLQRASLWACLATLGLNVLGCADDGGDAKEGEESMDSPATTDPGMGDGKDVITIGDSWMNLGGEGIQQSLEKASGRDYRNYGVGGTRLLNGQIPMQYEMAKAENPDIKTVIMTAGGNDILQDISVHFQCIDSAFDTSDVCKKRIDEVAARLVTLWAQMAEDGVKDVIIIGYTKKAGLLGPLSKSAEYSNMKIPPLCDAVPAPLNCHAFDSDLLVPSIALRIDGIHPDAASYDALGAALWKYMGEEKVRR